MSDTTFSSKPRPKIVVVGSINLDLVVSCVRLPRPGETVAGRSLAEIPGGKGANQAVAAARLGAEVSMVGRLGDDTYGRRLREGLISAGVDATHVRDTVNCQSGLAAIGVDDAGENAIVVVSGANGRVSAADVEASEDAFRSADVLLVQLEVPLDALVAAAGMARKHGASVIVDPAPAVDSLPAELLAADVICPNETEAARLFGRPVETAVEAFAAATWFCERGAAVTIVKRGERGCVVATRDGERREFGSYRVAAVDSTGAGDAFAGGLGVALSEGLPLDRAIRLASAAGALAATKHGAQPAMPTRNEVEQLIAAQPSV